MVTSIRMRLVGAAVLASLAGEGSLVLAAVAVGEQAHRGKELTYCFFGAQRKDGRILVHLVPGAAGRGYRMRPDAPVTLNGALVGPKYLHDGMPIILLLDDQGAVAEIRIRSGGR